MRDRHLYTNVGVPSTDAPRRPDPARPLAHAHARARAPSLCHSPFRTAHRTPQVFTHPKGNKRPERVLEVSPRLVARPSGAWRSSALDVSSLTTAELQYMPVAHFGPGSGGPAAASSGGGSLSARAAFHRHHESPARRVAR